MSHNRKTSVAAGDRSRQARYAPLAAAISGVLAGVSAVYAAEEKAAGDPKKQKKLSEKLT